MINYEITGGKPLKGKISPIPNKNSILKLIPAAILADETVILRNVPKSSSVRVMLNIFRDLGGKISYLGNDSIKLYGNSINKYSINQELASKERASFMFLGPLLARFGKAEIGDSGGCKLGNRPLDSMFQGLSSLGVKIDKQNGYSLSTNGLKGVDPVWLYEASVTGTENLVLASVLAKGQTVIYNAACEPHTQDLCNFLVSIGADIKGIGTNRLEINGVKSLKGGEWTVIPDHLDVGGLIIASAITGGELTINNAIPEHMTQILQNFAKLNLNVEIEKDTIFVPANQKLVAKSNFKGNIDKIKAEPWPGFPVDLIPEALVLALVAEGNIIVFNPMYETQLLFVQELLKMKASLIMADQNRVITFGPSKLTGTAIFTPSILQCAHAMVLAGLAASGKTKILNTEIIARRYPDLVTSLSKLGADIKQVRGF